MDIAPYLLLAYSTYAIGTISPGPANLSIMATSMEAGRGAGLALALGVIAGSLTWGIVAALGLGALLQTYAAALVVLKILGGLYLLYLAYRALRAALRDAPLPTAVGAKRTREGSLRAHFLRGFGIHITNPKAIVVWTSVIALGLPPGAPPELVVSIVGGCCLLGVLIFGTYALAFSTEPMIRAYARMRRGLNAAMAVFFGVAGTRLLLSQP